VGLVVTAGMYTVQVHRRAARLDPAWPILAMTAWMPVAYFLGLSAIVWIIPAFAFGIPMLRRQELRVPTTAVPLLALMLWIPVTALRLPSSNALGVFTYRWLIWVATVSVLLWLCNTSTKIVATKRIIDMLATLFIVLVGFGYLALAFPTTVIPSLMQRVMPHGLLSTQFIYDLTVVKFAELQTFATGTLARPAAPLPATNGWGSTLALLVPFFIISYLTAASRRRRVVGWCIAAAALVPFVVSTNRGAWLSVIIALIYFAARRAFRGDARPLGAILMLGAVVIASVLFTPLGQVVETRLSGSGVEQSNATRENVYKVAWERTELSPVLGYGAPESTDRPPPIGTHGLFWYVTFSHGFLATAMLLFATLVLVGATWRAPTDYALWAHICLVIFATQILYYGLLPQIVLVGIAAGICWREEHPLLAEVSTR
jgi:polysaccharide biosynthesis protein PslJ